MVTVRRDLLADALGFYAGFLAERESDPVLRREVELARSRVSAMHMLLGDLADAERELVPLVDQLRQDAQRPDADDETIRVFADVAGRLGEVHARRASLDEAEARIRESTAAFERIPEERRTAYAELQRGGSYDKLAELEQRRGREAESEAAARQAVTVSRAGQARFPEEGRFALALGRQLDRLGTILLRSKRVQESVEPLSEAVVVLEGYHAREPSDAHGREKLAAAAINLANALLAVRRAPEAKQRSEQALALGEALVRDYPDVPSYRSDLAIANLQLFAHAYFANDFELAETHIQRAIELQETVAREKPSDSTFLAELAGTCNNHAVLLLRRGDKAGSLASTERGLAHIDQALSIAPGHPQWREIRRSMHNNRGMALLDLGRWRDAVEAAELIDKVPEAQWCTRRAQLYERSARLAAVDSTLAETQRATESAALRERAIDELVHAVELGHRDWSELSDPDEWTSVRDDRRFVELVERSSQPR
jgi:tetratricopeptide (TPR) repeat protein